MRCINAPADRCIFKNAPVKHDHIQHPVIGATVGYSESNYYYLVPGIHSATAPIDMWSIDHFWLK